MIDPFNDMEEFGPTIPHARVCVQRIEVILVITLPFFPLFYLLKQRMVVIEALLLAKPVPSTNTIDLTQVHLHVLLHANLSFLLLVS